MFTSIKIKNFKCINEEIALNFISKSKGKENSLGIFKTHDNTYINRIISIIGENAAGKTTILHAINYLKLLFSLDITLDEEIKEIKKQVEYYMNSRDLLKENLEEFERLRINFSKKINGISLSVQNILHNNDPTIIDIETYIQTDDNETTGYYNYYIEFTKNIIVHEKLLYRDRIRNKKNLILEGVNVTNNQVRYFVNNYNNLTSLNIELAKKNNIKYIKTFYNHIKSSSFFESSNFLKHEDPVAINRTLVNQFMSNKELFVKSLCSIDKNIKNIEIDNEKSDYPKVKFMVDDTNWLNYSALSNGSKTFLKLMCNSKDVSKTNSFILADEIETGLNKQLLHSYFKLIKENNSCSQILFSTHYPEILDNVKYPNGETTRICKNDSIFVLYKDRNKIDIKKISDIKVNEKNIKIDASISNYYYDNKIASHPDIDKIESIF